MNEPGGWERQLSELMTIAAGEPRREVSIQMVRRRLVRRRVSIAAAAAAVAVVLGGIGAAAATAAVGGHRGTAAGSLKAPGVPSYYVQSVGRARPVVRSRTTGAVTGTVRCPWRGTGIYLSAVAPASNRTFFAVCEMSPGGTPSRGVQEARIYRFRLTVAGRIRGYALVPGGTLSRLAVESVAATADGSELALSVSPATGRTGVRPGSVVVLNTRTGARRIWQGSSGKPGTIKYPVISLSLTASGREAVFLTQPRCVPAVGHPKCHVGGGEEVRALSLTSHGGQVSHSRLLVRQADLMRIAVGYINAAVISPDGSLLTLAEVSWPVGYISIVQVSAVTGKQTSVLYRLRTGDGFSYSTFSADPSARYFILAAGRPRGPIKNGWIDHGRLFRLWPRDGSDVAWEVW